MATDGVKIIDGDLAHDVYHTFMDLYDAGEPLGAIKSSLEQLQIDNDDVDDEIFITAYALALWETGQLDEETLSQVALAIKEGAFAKYLTHSAGAPNDGRKRQQVLNRFWTKISQPIARARKRKECKHQTKFIFNEGDVLVFQMQDGTYRATILLLISQHGGRCSYEFAMPNCISTTKPFLNDIVDGEIMGRIAPSSRLGFNVVGISHKDLRAFADKFELVGNLKINPSAQCCGTQRGAVNFESFADSFRSFNSFLDVKMTAKTHPNNVFPIRTLL